MITFVFFSFFFLLFKKTNKHYLDLILIKKKYIEGGEYLSL
jgi:hypothetical protein